MSVEGYLDRLTTLVDTLSKYNDSDTDSVVNMLIASKIRYEEGVKMDMYTRKANEKSEISKTARSALDFLDTQLTMASSYRVNKPRLYDTEGKGPGSARKIIGKGGLIDTDKYEWLGDADFSLSRGGGLMFDGARRRKDARAYLDMHDAQAQYITDAVAEVRNAKWALGDDDPIVVRGKAKILEEYNHLVESRNNLVKIDTYALADGYNPIGNKIARGKETTILDDYDVHIAKYEGILDMIDTPTKKK